MKLYYIYLGDQTFRHAGDPAVILRHRRPMIIVSVDSINDFINALKALDFDKTILEAVRGLTRSRNVSNTLRMIGDVLVMTLWYAHISGKSVTLYPLITVAGKDVIVVNTRIWDDYLRGLLIRSAKESNTIYDALVHLLEAITGTYIDAADCILERVESLEARIIRSLKPIPARTLAHNLNMMLGAERRIRRAISSMRIVLEALCRLLDKYTESLESIRDHTVREAMELIEYGMGRIHDLINIYLSIQSTRLNEIMKFLTVIGTIFIPLTFITGIYGMNFNTSASPWNMPELNHPLGYPLTLLAMLIIALTMVIYFKRKQWI